MSSRLTKFLQDYIAEQADQELYPLKLGFYTKKEKSFKGLRFDAYAYSKKRGIILIWEMEINNCLDGCITNVRKVQQILNSNGFPMYTCSTYFLHFVMNTRVYARKERRNYKRRMNLGLLTNSLPFQYHMMNSMKYMKHLKKAESAQSENMVGD